MSICERCGEEVTPIVGERINGWRTTNGSSHCPATNGTFYPHEVPVFPDFHDIAATEQWLAS